MPWGAVRCRSFPGRKGGSLPRVPARSIPVRGPAAARRSVGFSTSGCSGPDFTASLFPGHKWRSFLAAPFLHGASFILDLLEVFAERFGEAGGEDGDAVLLAFAVVDGDAHSGEIEVLDAEAEFWDWG